MSRRWRYPRTRRGKFTDLVPAAAVTAPPPWLPAVLRQIRVVPLPPRSGRRRFLEPPWPQVVVTVPGVPPGVVRLVARRVPGVRRGRLTVPPPPVPLPPPVVSRVRARWPVARRGRFVSAPPPVVIAPPAYVPQVVRARTRLPLPRRGRFAAPPWQQQQQAPPAYIPAVMTSRRPQTRVLRRGRFTGPLTTVAAVASPWSPQSVTRRRVQLPRLRRGGFLVAPPVTGPVGPRLRSRRPAMPRTRAGGFTQPPWPQVVAQPSVWRPQVVVARRRVNLRLRRGRLFEPMFACPPPTTRPVAGVTARPSAGMTVRAAGTTARPDTGTTSRPDDGTTPAC